ncbi:hypothetical protein LXL04_004845 [Taraxacum kok-saghyz]
MEGRENISEYRDRLDKTLLSHDLSNVEFLKNLVENQISKSPQHEDQEYSDNLVQTRTKVVANFLGMLRSSSGSVEEVSQNGWKIKHDNQDCRVMYREGPVGTPLHTLLAEGYVDGPLDACVYHVRRLFTQNGKQVLKLSIFERSHNKMWPQFNIPTFKVTSSEIVKKIRMGEQISLVRMKLSWPLSTREALIHYVTLDYFQDGLIIVLLNSISESEIIDEDTHGFTKDGIPDVENVTRIDVVGGVAIQKVSATRSYFRTIANMDIKLDFVPPTVINFVSRQLIGSGFKLYKKKVASVCKGDEDFSKALNDPCYSRIRDALYSNTNIPKQESIKIVDDILQQQDIKNNLQLEEIQESKNQKPVCEIEEIEENEKPHEDNSNNNNINNIKLSDNSNKKLIISPEVNQALGTLEKVISIFREIGFNPRSMSLSRFANNVFADLEDNKKSTGSKRFVPQVNESMVKTSQESRNGFADHEDTTIGTHRSSFSFVVNEVITSTLAEKNAINGEIKNIDESVFSQKRMKNIDESGFSQKRMKKVKKQRFCCINFTSGRLVD